MVNIRLLLKQSLKLRSYTKIKDLLFTYQNYRIIFNKSVHCLYISLYERTGPVGRSHRQGLRLGN